MKKLLLFFILLTVFLVPQLAMGQAVGCGNDGQEPCTLAWLFGLVVWIYNFIVWYIATPLATLMIVIGGIMILISGGNPGLASNGKNILKVSIIAILLIWGAYLIIESVFGAIGYGGGINPPFF